MDASTLAALGAVEEDFYVVVRSDRVNAATLPDYFQRVHEEPTLSLWKVDTARCRADAESGRYPVVPEEELLRESGLE
jgi:hypothetical protein